MNTEPEVPPQDRLMQSLVAFMLIQMDGELQRRLLQIEVGMMCLDGNGRYTYLDPYLGAATAIAEGCRNLAAVGASPIGATNCLNFGNPEKPEIMWQFSKVIDGIRDACQHFQVPITGGNVSFYNETEGEGIFPTPVVGLVGILEDRRLGVTHHFKGKSDLIYLLGATSEEFGGSEYLKVIHGRVDGKPPRLDLEVETAVQDLLRRAAARGLLRSAHDLADGGLGVALAESLFGPLGEMMGASIALETRRRAEAVLFSESQSRILVSVAPREASELERLADEAGGSPFPPRRHRRRPSRSQGERREDNLDDSDLP